MEKNSSNGLISERWIKLSKGKPCIWFFFHLCIIRDQEKTIMHSKFEVENDFFSSKTYVQNQFFSVLIMSQSTFC